VCVCSLRYPACEAHEPYRHLWPVWFYHIFPHYLLNGTVLGKRIIEHSMCVLIFSKHFGETFLIFTRTERHIIVNVRSLHVNWNWMKLEFSRQIICTGQIWHWTGRSCGPKWKRWCALVFRAVREFLYELRNYYFLKKEALCKFNNFPTRYDLFSLLHYCRQLYMFWVLIPIIRRSYNWNTASDID